MQQLTFPYRHQAWNRRRATGQKTPFKRQEIWAIRFRLQLGSRKRNLALFNLAIDSKLRGCDLVSLRVRDICNGDEVLPRAKVIQRKTGKPVHFEITVQTRSSVGTWISKALLNQDDYSFPSGVSRRSHLSTRQYARSVNLWTEQIGWTRRTMERTPQAHQSVNNLSKVEEPASSAATARTYQVGEHGPLSRC